MLDNAKLVFIINQFRQQLVDRTFIKSIIDNYDDDIPSYVIKYLSIYYPQITAECITDFIVSHPKSARYDVIDIVLSTYNIRLCDVPYLTDITCIDECMCYSREIWKILYIKLLDVIKKNPIYFLSYQNFNHSFTSLIAKTDVLDDQLFELVNNIAKNHKNWNAVIKLIKDCSLYSSNYGTIILKMKDSVPNSIRNRSQSMSKLQLNPTNPTTSTKTSISTLTPSLTSGNDSIKRRPVSDRKQNSDAYWRLMISTVLRRYNELHQNICHINSTLYLSDVNIPKNVAILREKKIQHIITITKKSIFMVNDIDYTHLMIDDIGTENFVQKTLKTVLHVIDLLHRNEVVLVHCHKGQSRSVCFVILVLIHQGMSFDEAYDLVQTKRPSLDPNPEFIDQIIEHCNLK